MCATRDILCWKWNTEAAAHYKEWMLTCITCSCARWLIPKGGHAVLLGPSQKTVPITHGGSREHVRHVLYWSSLYRGLTVAYFQNAILWKRNNGQVLKNSKTVNCAELQKNELSSPQHICLMRKAYTWKRITCHGTLYIDIVHVTVLRGSCCAKMFKCWQWMENGSGGYQCT